MNGLPEPIAHLVEQLGQLPGIGPKSAQRLAFHVLSMPDARIEELVGALTRVKEELVHCAECYVITDRSPCDVCGDPERDHTTICVVGDTRDMIALERMRSYRGLYHVLGGLISPMEGIGPDQIRLRELLSRLADEGVRELILATSSTVEGEATAMYIARLARPFEQLVVTRIAHGLPVGGDIEYADDITLARALQFRRPME